MKNPNLPVIDRHEKPPGKPADALPYVPREKTRNYFVEAAAAAELLTSSYTKFLSAAAGLDAAAAALAVHFLPAALQAPAEQLLRTMRGGT